MRILRRWSIAKKLNVVQAVLLTLLLFAVNSAITYWLSGLLEAQSLANMRQSNQQAVDMIDSYSQALDSEVERLANVLQGNFSSSFTLEETEGRAQLRSGNLILNGNEEILDRFTRQTGAIATLFARQGDDFLRVATSLRKENGERAVGTMLGANHPGIQALLEGSYYTGKAKLFGRDYMTRYVPQRDKSGRVVAILFIGLDFTAELKVLKDKIKHVAFNRSGYIFAVDAGKERGTFTIHPSSEGKNLLDAKDPDGIAYIEEITRQKNGQLEYKFANPNLKDSAPQAKIAVFTHYPKWDWVVVSSTYLDELSENAHMVRNVLQLSGLVLSLIMAILTSLLLAKWVSRPLAKTVNVMQAMAKGNLSQGIPRHTHQDEVGKLLIATQEMADSMAEAIASMQAASVRLTESSRQMNQASSNVASQSSQQSEAAASMAASIEEMETSIRHVRDCATDAAELAKHAGRTSGEGAQIIDQAVESISRIAATVRDASASVARLGQESAAIAEIVSTIRGIAEQTNLLALNAAIEAARAGEAGRGFAVVADEVKKLAQSTASSTQEIEGMISKILAETQSAVGSIESGVTQVEQGVTLAGEAGKSIAAIQQNADEVSKAVTSISFALSEQSAATEELARNVVGIAETADQNAITAQSSAKQAGSLEHLSGCLNEQMARFELGERVILRVTKKR